MLLPHVLDVAQPVVAQAEAIAPEGRTHPAATVMAADDDVTHLEHVDRELHDRETIEIGVHDDVRHVAMDEEFARREVDDLVRRHPAIGAADPEILRRLLAGKFKEEIGLLRSNALGPGAVVFEEVPERSHVAG